MAYANIKEYLQKRNEKILAARPKPTGKLFSAQNFYFNGFISSTHTLPEIKQLVHIHGANISNFYNAKVTLVITTQLSASKMKTRVPVVRLEYILDCIAAKRMLAVTDEYRVIPLIKDPNQIRIDTLLQDGSDPVDLDLEEEDSDPGINPDLDYNDPKVLDKLCTAPNFIDQYFANSRLHFLSTLKAELVAFTSLKMKNKTPSKSEDRILFHVDMDCFFASVALLSHPDLVSKPVVIAHATDPSSKSTSEVSSCNYLARSFGISNGQILLNALQKCPGLVVLPYDFEKISEISKLVYQILIETSGYVQAVSCDEAVIDVTDKVGDDVIGYAEMIRKEIFQLTKCTASIGIGFNILTARVATFSAKPNGVFRITRQNLGNVFEDFKVSKLPGVGYVKRRRFEELGIETCGDALVLSEVTMKSEFGTKLGKRLFEFMRGIDTRVLDNKNAAESISVEINWAVRFTNLESLKQFVKEMALYLEKRMHDGTWTGLQITIKKRDYKGEPVKYLGCGRCLTFNKTRTRQNGYKDSEQISKDSFTMFMELQMDPCEVRGIGMQLKQSIVKLALGQKVIDFSKPAERNDGLAEFKAKYRGADPFTINPIHFPTMKMEMLEDMVKAGVNIDLRTRNLIDTTDYLPTSSQIDPEVLAALPKSIRMEQIAVAKLKSKHKKGAEVVKIDEDDLLYPKLGGESDFKIVLEMVSDWVESWKDGVPLEEDIEHVVVYLGNMVKSYQLDKAVRILKRIVQSGRKNGKEKQASADCRALIFQRFNSIVYDIYECDLDFDF